MWSDPFPTWFCRDALWDSNLTWYTERPRLTTCFQDTVLTWIPCFFLVFFFPLKIIHLRKVWRDPYPASTLSNIKLVLCAYMIVASIVELSPVLNHWSAGNSSLGEAELFAACSKLIIAALSTFYTYIDKCRGRSPGGLAFVFWLTFVLCETLRFWNIVDIALLSGVKEKLLFFVRLSWLPLTLTQIILSCLTDPVTAKRWSSKAHPAEYASFFNKLLFWYFNSLGWKGWKRLLTQEDMYDCLRNDSAHVMVNRLQKNWDAQLIRTKRTGRGSPSIIVALLKTFWKDAVITGFLRLAWDLALFASPQILSFLIGFVNSSAMPAWKGYLFVVGLLGVLLLQTVAAQSFQHLNFRTGMRVEVSLFALIFRKALRMTNEAKQSKGVGEVVNLMAVDASRFFLMTVLMHFLWAAPLQIILGMYYLYGLFGLSSVAGLVTILLTVPLNAFALKKAKLLQVLLTFHFLSVFIEKLTLSWFEPTKLALQLKEKDKRLKLTAEILTGIKVLKLYAWEPAFEKMILGYRFAELELRRKEALWDSTTNIIFVMTPYLVALTTFTTYLFVEKTSVLSPEKIFVALSVFNILRLPLSLMSPAVTSAVLIRVCAQRVANFLKADELDLGYTEKLPEKDVVSVQVKHGAFRWKKSDQEVLRDINMEVRSGQLVVIVGPTGSGKSSLCSAIVGLPEKTAGTVARKADIALVSQQPWIQNLTIKDNILFGRSYQSSRYKKVIEICALKSDFDQFPQGDETVIGERGGNLSGGQRQRISIARAVYSDASVYIFDDPFAALDVHVGKQIFDNVIGPNGFLKGKTRILTTHDLSVLPLADRIFVLSSNTISESGTYYQLLEKEGDFAAFLHTHLTGTTLEDQRNDNLPRSEMDQQMEIPPEKRTSVQIAQDVLRRASKTPSVKSTGVLAKKSKGPLIVEEQSTESRVSFRVFLIYMRNLSYVGTALLFFLYAAYSVLSTGANFWLSDWAKDRKRPERKASAYWTNVRLGTYGAFGVAQVLFLGLYAVTLAFSKVRASRLLHEAMLKRVLRAPMSFFDVTPLGRLINRFSKDMDLVDGMLPGSIQMFLFFGFGVLSTIVVVCVNAPRLIAVVVPLCVVYYFMQLKRLQNISRSPIFSHFQESLAGSSTITAMRQIDRFIKWNEHLVDRHTSCYYAVTIALRWMGLRLDLLAMVLTVGVALFAVFGKNKDWGMEPEQAGLSIAYCLAISNLLNGFLRLSNELESQIVSVERIQEYSEVAQEAEWENTSHKLTAGWPKKGVVDFDNYSLRYRKELSPVLKNFNAKIKSGEKIGIVGRTGAGKTSISLAMFRIVEAAGGTIRIDGVDISSLGLHDLRRRLTILPQEPVLFSGTLRMNLDPFDRFTDAQIWDALEHSHLKAFVGALPNGLQTAVVDGGDNYSAGQRQLICLARALLRKSKVLVLDEATAAVDLETDQLIQRTIREQFADCTVLTIAHRINTILDSTRILVLDQGVIREFAPPDELLKDPQSLFYSLAKTANLAM